MYLNETDRKLKTKKNIDEFNLSIKRKSLIRYVSVIIDFSSAARRQEMRPNRAIVIKNYLTVMIIILILIFSNLSLNSLTKTRCPNFALSPLLESGPSF